MRHKLSCASCMVAVAVICAAPAYADTDHGVECGEGTATSTPGNAASSPGSVFNEPGVNSLNGGKGNQAYSSNARQGTGAPSQYDVACGKVSVNGTGTPMQTAGPPLDEQGNPTDVTNNSLATREANGVVPHTGKGANK
jgi:hypothetical protein